MDHPISWEIPMPILRLAGISHGDGEDYLQDPVFPRMDISNNWAASTKYLQAYQMFNYTDLLGQIIHKAQSRYAR